MDTRFWGPSAWQLFHLIAFRSEHPDDVLNAMKDILPCRFCRESTTEFVTKHPLRGDPGKWLYEIHAMVNAKLRNQAAEDPSVIDPGPDPSFEEVKARYARLKPTKVPGRDFLFSIATNYPDDPEAIQMATQRTFLSHLAEAYPVSKLRGVFANYMDQHPAALNTRLAYMRWMYGLLRDLSKAVRADLPSYRGYAHHVAYYKSGCNKSTYHGKTCRNLAGGGRTKTRDTRKTRKITHERLLHVTGGSDE